MIVSRGVARKRGWCRFIFARFDDSLHVQFRDSLIVWRSYGTMGEV